MGLNPELVKNNYILLPNFIDVDKAKALSDEFKEFCNKEDMSGDWQVPLSQAYRNYISFLEIIVDRSHQVSEIVGEMVLPTSAYARISKHDAILEPHKDNASCEIVITINLDCDHPWEFWIRTPYPSNKSVSHVLNPGDAMLYLGQDAWHWRNKYEGQYYTGLFLCYVLSRGDCSFIAREQIFTHGPGIQISPPEYYKKLEDEKRD